MDNDELKKDFTVQSMDVIFLIMGVVGAIMALGSSLKPLFLAHFLPALIILICVLVFFLWRGAGKGVKMTLAIVSLLLGPWLVVNAVTQIYIPAIQDVDISVVVEGDWSVLIPHFMIGSTLLLGAVGGLIIFIGSIFGIVSTAKG
ncbi:MAG: hypothetical protein WBC55_11095 [Dehalococcoidia bacterium]